MNNILIVGAGRSTISLISYLLEHSEEFSWNITICDRDISLVKSKIGFYKNAKAIEADITNDEQRDNLISTSDIVISMLPAHMHIPIAQDCIKHKAHMVTASYVSKEMLALNEEAKKAGVVFMNEIGVDPGVDHLSAKKLLDKVTEDGGEMLIFESFTGGLISPECEGDNPWQYKFTWNPRNVVLAGTGVPVKFKQEGLYKYIPHYRLFRRTEIIEIEGLGKFEGYPNRDSLKYRKEYGLEEIPTIFRGTLRRPGFCRSWNIFVQLGMTDDTYTIAHSKGMTFREFTNSFLPYNLNDSVELKLMHYLHIPHDDELIDKLNWIGIFDDVKIDIENATPAQILEVILKRKWSLEPKDKDMIVMYHKIGFELNGEKKMIESSMVTFGDDAENTAMAKTVGLPVAIATKLILEGDISTPGVHIPISKEIYTPMLRELEENGIIFNEKEIPYKGY